MESFTDFIFLFFKNANRGIVHIPFLINKKIPLLIVSIFLLFTSSGNAIDSPFNFKFEVNKISFLNNFTPPSPLGLITVNFEPGEEGKYLHVLAENQAEDTSGFILENLYLLSKNDVDTTLQFAVSFAFSKVSRSFNLPIQLTLTAYITDFPEYFPFMSDSIAEITTVNVTEIIFNAGGMEVDLTPVIPAPINDLLHPLDDTVKVITFRPDVDNIDLDSSSHPPTTSYAGDKGASAPAAAAASFHWLAKRYPDVKLPQNQTLRKTLEDLSSLMRRRNNSAPLDFQVIQGKLDLIVSYRLPVDVKFQCWGIDEDVTGGFGTKATNMNPPNGIPTWEFLKQMIQEGEDVEIIYGSVDSTGSWVEAQTVTVTGLLEYPSGIRYIAFKHDINERCPGGTKDEVYKAGEDNGGWLRFGPHYEYYIRCIIAESPDGPEFSILPVEQVSSVPQRYELAQNYPNPFNPISNIEFRIAELGFVSLKVYDLLGNEISTLVNEEKPAGEYHITFDALNLSSGVYYYTLKAGSFVETKKMVVLK